MTKYRKARKAWNRMMARCYNPGHQSYQYYGGRGITVDERWHVFENFLSDMGEAPLLEATLGRKDNDGVYTKDNCRWETWEEQARNKGMYANNTSGVKGVTYISTRAQWRAEVRVNGRKKNLYSGKSFKEACAARRAFDLSNPIH